MKRHEFIQVLECALKCADKSILKVSLAPGDPDEIQVHLDDMSTICVEISNRSLVEILHLTACAVIIEHHKERHNVKSQRITRRGISFNGQWYCTGDILMYLGRQVYVIPVGRSLMIQDMASGHLIGRVDLG